jgi:hypothetical protein
MPNRSSELSPMDVGLVLGTLLNAAAECEESACRNSNYQPAFADTMLARARALLDVAARFEFKMLEDLEPVGTA